MIKTELRGEVRARELVQSGPAIVENPLWIQYCRPELLSPTSFCRFK